MRLGLELVVALAGLAAAALGCSGKTATGAATPAPVKEPSSGKAQVEWVASEPAGVSFTRTEITAAQYQACVDAGRCTAPLDEDYCNSNIKGRDDHPVNCIDWSQAKAVCSWVEGRLPTEDEWHAEASDGGRRLYPWGDEEVTCQRAIWKKGCGRESTWPVCSRPGGNSVSGLCDMSGNVWEWTVSMYDGVGRVVRGGSWLYDFSDALRAANRGRNLPTDRNNHLGVRCVR